MAKALTKGGDAPLSGEEPGLKSVLAGLGWDARATDGSEFDLDASAFMLNDQGKVRQDDDFIFYNNLRSPDGSVEHTGDNRTGEGDDETIILDLGKIPADVARIAITVTIHEADVRRQNFGMVSNAFIRVVNQGNNRELARFDLSEDMSTETAMIFGEVYRQSGEWKFRAIGQGCAGGLRALALHFGVDV